MRILIKKIQTWKIDDPDLPGEVKGKILEKHCDINVDYEWWDYISEEIESLGGKLEAFDQARYCEISIKSSWEEFAQNILENHGETCETHKTAKKYLQARDEGLKAIPHDTNGDPDNAKIDAFLDGWERDFRQEIQEDYRILLRKEYEYQTSEEAIIETLRANDYDFDEKGNTI